MACYENVKFGGESRDRTGREPKLGGFTVRYSTIAVSSPSVGQDGVEPPLSAYQAPVLPLNYWPKSVARERFELSLIRS